MHDEISAGLKNALERGYSLEEAIKTFVNAGYNPVEVKEAATFITGGATSILNNPASANLEVCAPNQASGGNAPKNSSFRFPLSVPVASGTSNSTVQAYQNLMGQKKSSGKKTILMISLLIFLILLLILFILNRESILDYLSSFI